MIQSEAICSYQARRTRSCAPACSTMIRDIYGITERQEVNKYPSVSRTCNGEGVKGWPDNSAHYEQSLDKYHFVSKISKSNSITQNNEASETYYVSEISPIITCQRLIASHRQQIDDAQSR